MLWFPHSTLSRQKDWVLSVWLDDHHSLCRYVKASSYRYKCDLLIELHTLKTSPHQVPSFNGFYLTVASSCDCFICYTFGKSIKNKWKEGGSLMMHEATESVKGSSDDKWWQKMLVLFTSELRRTHREIRTRKLPHSATQRNNEEGSIKFLFITSNFGFNAGTPFKGMNGVSCFPTRCRQGSWSLVDKRRKLNNVRLYFAM